ncbi:hypothetical protein ATG71_0336 [Bacillus sp. es.034]|nr:hypothetical protein ATG71_0336 [Bacillus sp. es.034]
MALQKCGTLLHRTSPLIKEGTKKESENAPLFPILYRKVIGIETSYRSVFIFTC